MEKKRILIVDDDPDLVETVSMMLEARKFFPIPAYGGIEGLEKASKERPDLIVLDVMMPDKDGYAVCNELKKDPVLKEIPIILLTAIGDHITTSNYTLRGGMETFADDFFQKPVNIEALVNRIEQLLKS
jgi:two-component system, OmpR family, alkaline phosphatase synthesis response regulator PhoP